MASIFLLVISNLKRFWTLLELDTTKLSTAYSPFPVGIPGLQFANGLFIHWSLLQLLWCHPHGLLGLLGVPHLDHAGKTNSCQTEIYPNRDLEH